MNTETLQSTAEWVGDLADARPYNIERFRLRDTFGSLRRARAMPRLGEPAPDFHRPSVFDGSVRLSALRGRPVLLRFVSRTCPQSVAAVEPFRGLYAEFGDRVHVIEVYTRQAHPGRGLPSHHSFAEKAADAVSYAREHAIGWPVLVDDLYGSVHLAYGGLDSACFLIDAQGRIAFRQIWSHAPTMHWAIERLLERDGVGIVGRGTDWRPHPLAVFTDGWPALRRAGAGAVPDVVKVLPPLPAVLWLGHRLRDVLHPITQRSRPLPRAARVAIGLGLATGLAAGGLGVWARARRRACARSVVFGSWPILP